MTRPNYKTGNFKILYLFVFLCTSLCSWDDSAAQAHNIDLKLNGRIPRKLYNPDNEYVPEVRKYPPDLPFLPPYPNNPEFSRILVLNRLSDGPCFNLTFHVKDEPENVINFYAEALKQNRWQLMSNGSSGKMIGARRKSAMVDVKVMAPLKKGSKTQVYLVYQVTGRE